MCVCQPLVVVQDHDGGDAARGHHEHDASEVGSLKFRGFNSTFISEVLMSGISKIMHGSSFKFSQKPPKIDDLGLGFDLTHIDIYD